MVLFCAALFSREERGNDESEVDWDRLLGTIEGGALRPAPMAPVDTAVMVSIDAVRTSPRDILLNLEQQTGFPIILPDCLRGGRMTLAARVPLGEALDLVLRRWQSLSIYTWDAIGAVISVQRATNLSCVSDQR